jgi:secreted PhoX family phosphatase
MGRAGWESVTELNTGVQDKVAFLIGDDRAGAPLLLYVGEKGEGPMNAPDLLKRNGLAQGSLYVWVADEPSFIDPSDFNGTGSSATGRWEKIEHYDSDMAGMSGYDHLGFADQDTQDALAAAAGAFQFSRPEDVSTNPENGTQAVLASTGRGQLFDGADDWGTTYIIDTEFDADGNPLTATASILYDGDDAGGGQFSDPDFGLRSPDNLDWADNGLIYIQEDRSTRNATFGGVSGEEASIWELDPVTGLIRRVAQINRDADLPDSQTDGDPTDLGDWESSGILDVSELFGQKPGSLFIFDVQAHSVRDGLIGDLELVEGGQLAFMLTPQSGFWGAVQAADNAGIAL